MNEDYEHEFMDRMDEIQAQLKAQDEFDKWQHEQIMLKSREEMVEAQNIVLIRRGENVITEIVKLEDVNRETDKVLATGPFEVGKAILAEAINFLTDYGNDTKTYPEDYVKDLINKLTLHRNRLHTESVFFLIANNWGSEEIHRSQYLRPGDTIMERLSQ